MTLIALNESQTEVYQGEKEVVKHLLSLGEDLNNISEICSDPNLSLNQRKVKSLLKAHFSLQNDKNFIYVPSINLYVAKERTHLNQNWFECHKLLQANGERMLILPEFIEFLKYCKINHPNIYEGITAVRNPAREEWIDADFKVKGKDLLINYNHILDSNGNLIPQNSEPLNKNTLIRNKHLGISLENYLNNNHTSQGLPTKKVKSGDLYYWYPRRDNNSVAGFGAGSGRASLGCSWIPSDSLSVLGVRAVKQSLL